MINLDLTSYQLPPKKKTWPRKELTKQLYQLYSEDKEELRKQNWRNYVKYLKEYCWANTPEHLEHFKKSNRFIKIYPIRQFCIFTSHLNEKDFEYILSVARDKKARRENVGGYIAGHFSKISK